VPGNVITATSCGNVDFSNNKIVPPGGVSARGLGKRAAPAAPAPSAGPNMGIVIDAAVPGVQIAGNGTDVATFAIQV
jgi:hypothetical protein